MPEGPEWDHYCAHLEDVECEDASGRTYFGVSLSSQRRCDDPICYLCTDTDHAVWAAKYRCTACDGWIEVPDTPVPNWMRTKACGGVH